MVPDMKGDVQGLMMRISSEEKLDIMRESEHVLVVVDAMLTT